MLWWKAYRFHSWVEQKRGNPLWKIRHLFMGTVGTNVYLATTDSDPTAQLVSLTATAMALLPIANHGRHVLEAYRNLKEKEAQQAR